MTTSVTVMNLEQARNLPMDTALRAATGQLVFAQYFHGHLPDAFYAPDLPATVLYEHPTREPDAEVVERVATDSKLLEVARLAVEDALVEMRDSCTSLLGRRNGLVIATRSGEPSDIIRMSTEDAMRVGLKAIAAALNAANGGA
jgi:hypothetical protein